MYSKKWFHAVGRGCPWWKVGLKRIIVRDWKIGWGFLETMLGMISRLPPIRSVPSGLKFKTFLFLKKGQNQSSSVNMKLTKKRGKLKILTPPISIYSPLMRTVPWYPLLFWTGMDWDIWSVCLIILVTISIILTMRSSWWIMRPLTIQSAF